MLTRGVDRLMSRAAAITALVIVASLPPAAPAADADGDALVIVNGRPIARQQVVDVLMETHGLQIMQQLVTLELAKQETQRRGIVVSPADVEAQFQRAVDEIVPQVDADDVPLTAEGKQRALQTVLQHRCLTMPEFMLAMERNAHLRKAVEADFRVDEATLREEFARRYGEKVVVRHIQVPAGDTRALHEALDLLGRGVDFAEVAQRVSTNPQTAARGGLMDAFTFTDDQIPAALREVAFALAPGGVSAPTLTGKIIHILRMERRIPPSDARFEDVRQEVERNLRDRVVRQKMNEMITDLFRRAQIRVLDRQLEREFDELLKEFTSGQGAAP